MPTKLISFDRFGDLVWLGARGPIQRYASVQMYRRTAALLKVVRPPSDTEQMSDAIDAQKRLLLEAIATDRVVHPNVVRVVDAGISRDLESFIALELLRGSDLTEHVAARGRMSVPNALEMAIGIARALCAAHARGVLHGDVSPRHIFLLEEGGVKLTSFGRGCAPETESLRTPGRAQGAPAYMCPQYAATGALDERADLYSLGTTLYEAISGASPVAARGSRWKLSEPSLELQSLAAYAPVPLCDLVPGVVRELSREIHRAMAPNPKERHQSVEEFLDALERQRPSFARGGSRGHPAADHDSPTVPVGIVAARRADGVRETGRGLKTCEHASAPKPGVSRPSPADGEAIGGLPPSSTECETANASAAEELSRELPTIPEIRANAGARVSERSPPSHDAIQNQDMIRPEVAPATGELSATDPAGQPAPDAPGTASLSAHPFFARDSPSRARNDDTNATRPASSTHPSRNTHHQALAGPRSSKARQWARNDETVYGIAARPRAPQTLARRLTATLDPAPATNESGIVACTPAHSRCGLATRLMALLAAAFRAVRPRSRPASQRRCR